MGANVVTAEDLSTRDEIDLRVKSHKLLRSRSVDLLVFFP